MEPGELEDAAGRLGAVPLESFVAERTRLAKELRSAGDRAGAVEVAKLPKPTPPAWALNQLARTEPEAVAEWLETAQALRDVSARATQAGGEAVRSAMAAHRASGGRLLALVREGVRPGGRPLSAPMIDRIGTLLNAATADPRLAERLRQARVTEEPLSPASCLAPPEASATAEPAPTPVAAPKAKRPPKPDAEIEARRRRRVELEQRVTAAAQDVERRRKEASRRETAARIAEERLEDARRTLHRSESEAAAAQSALEDARDAAATAEQELQQLRALLRRG